MCHEPVEGIAYFVEKLEIDTQSPEAENSEKLTFPNLSADVESCFDSASHRVSHHSCSRLLPERIVGLEPASEACYVCL